MKNRDKLHYKVRKYPNNEIIKITYTRYRNFCNTLLKTEKRAYEKDRIKEAGNNNKKIWHIIKNITHTAKTKKIFIEFIEG